jgi:membrane-associated phospholipid phosphatase
MSRRAVLSLPRGWGDLGFQLSLWFGFVLAYQLARGLADRSVLEAIDNGYVVMDIERGLRTLVEVDVQQAVMATGGFLVDALNWTYWLSQFAVVGVALLWIYLFRNDAFARVRNWIFAANLIGLAGYVLMPTAPPRMFADEGFVDTLAHTAPLNHGSALVELASNPFAAMPSLHAADALIVGIALATLVRPLWLKVLWALWPAWVGFAVIATGNHFWLDIAAGVVVVGLAWAVLEWHRRRREELTPALSS